MHQLWREEFGPFGGSVPGTGSWGVGRWDCGDDLELGVTRREGRRRGERAGLEVDVRVFSSFCFGFLFGRLSGSIVCVSVSILLYPFFYLIHLEFLLLLD